MKWISNTTEDERHIYIQFLGPQAVFGDPQATDVYTVEQLKAMGMIGVYRDEVPL